MAGAALVAGSGLTVAQADPLGELAGFSSLRVDAAKLEKGDVISARLPGVTFSRGQVIESVFVVAAPPEKTVEALKGWNGGNQPDKIYLHQDLAGSPGAGNFGRLSSAPANGAVKNFANATAKGEVQLSAEELAAAPKEVEAKGITGPLASFWSSTLAKRAQAFAGGGLPAQPAYSVGGQSISAAQDAAALLKAAPKIGGQFRGALNAAGLNGKPSRTVLYYEVVNTEGTAAATLGSTAVTGQQAGEIQYYASGGYYVFLTAYQFWPYERGGKPATLVYRADLISAADLGKLRGIERNAAGSAMSKEVVRSINAFQKDAAR